MDKFEIIKQFKDLLDNGVITQEEFDAKKKELLGLDATSKQEQSVVEETLTEESAECPQPNDVVRTELTETKAVADAEESIQLIDKTDGPLGATEQKETEPNGSSEINMQPAEKSDEKTAEISAEQKKASMKGMILVGVIGAFVLLILVAILGSGSDGIKGSWNCHSVTYMGETLSASDAQVDDYTFKFTGSTFEANIYGAEASGTYEFTETVTLNDGTEADVYTLTTDSGAELTVAYFKSLKLLTLSPFGGVSESTYIAFKRR